MFKVEKIEYRPAKKGEWFWDRALDKVCQSRHDCTGYGDSMVVLIGYEPEKFVPKRGEYYYMPDPIDNNLYTKHPFYGNDDGNFRLEHNLVYPYTEEGKAQAIAHAKRMLEV